LLVDIADTVARRRAAEAGGRFRRRREGADDAAGVAIALLEDRGPVGQTCRIGRTAVIGELVGVDGIAEGGGHYFLVVGG
jgi:hypothetical protein